MIFHTLSIVLLCLDALLVVYLAFGEKIANKLCKGKKIKFAKMAYIAPIIVVLYATLVLQLVYMSTETGTPLSAFDFINVIDAVKKLFGASVSPGLLVSQSVPFYIALLFGALLAFGSTLFVTVKIVFCFIYNKHGAKHILRKGDCNIYFGYDPTVKYSAENTILWLTDTPSEELRKSLQAKGLHYVVLEFTAENLQIQFAKLCNKAYTFILNSKSANYFVYIGEFERFLKGNYAQGKACQNFKMFLLLEYDNYFTIRDQVLTDEVRVNHIVCVNMHETMALQFVEEHPITELLDGNAINYNTATVKEDCEINVVYVGFGKVAYSLFFNSVVNNQLACAKKTDKGYELRPKLVNYYAYDKNKVFVDGSNYNHSYGKQQSVLQFKSQSDYFPLPEKPCNFVYKGEFDINSQPFWQDITQILCANPNSYNSIFVSVGNDEDNIDEATKILLFMRQCNKQNFRIYVRIREHSEMLGSLFGENQKYVTYFGQDLSPQEMKDITVRQQKDAQKYHEIYKRKGGKEDIQNAWKSVYNARSDKYAAINMQLKLNLLGCKLQSANADADSKKSEKSPSGALDRVLAYNVMEKPYAERMYVAVENLSDIEPAKALAYQEKLRWNAFMMSNRFVPMEISEVEQTGNTKNFVTLKHACLTSVQGLHALHEKLVAVENAKLQKQLKQLKEKIEAVQDENERLQLRQQYNLAKNSQCTLEDVDLYKHDYNFRDRLQAILQEGDKEVVRRDC